MGLIMKLIENWRESWKMASMWVYMLILAMPDVYNAVAALEWADQLPEPAVWVIRTMAAIGVAARIVKQKSLEVQA